MTEVPVGDAGGVADLGRTAAKRRSIMTAATALFLRDGYRGTNMDQIALDAGVSKQTVYKQFSDKEQLFQDIVLGVTANSEAVIAAMAEAIRPADVDSADALVEVLNALGRRYLDGVLQPHVLALRRLVIAEADRFPELARTYYDQALARGIGVVTDAIRRWTERGLLIAPDPARAAAHFAYLVLAIPQDRAHFLPHEPPGPAEREHHVAEAVRIFLAAFGAPAEPTPARLSRRPVPTRR